MKRHIYTARNIVISFVLGFLMCIGLLNGIAQDSHKTDDDIQEIEGIWQGTLVAGGAELRIVFRIMRDSEGSLIGFMDSPDQGVENIPVEQIIVEADNVGFILLSGTVEFEGKLTENGHRLEGVWKQGGVQIPSVLVTVDRAPEVSRPQDPQKPYPYDELEVTFVNSEAGITLAGTLTIPSSTGPFPSVLLISGSGPQNRNEEAYGHRPFLVLSDFLTRSGMAVLRFDDRGVGESEGDFSIATSEDFASDALAAIDFLKEHRRIDSKRIGFIGHSEGGLIASIVASESSDIAFVVLLAAPGLVGEEILHLQSAAILKAAGAGEPVVAQARSINQQVYQVVREQRNLEKAEESIRQIMVKVGMNEEQIESQIGQLLSPWFRFFLTFDPRPVLMKIRVPVLAINGEKDVQVTPGENLAAIEAALKRGGNTRTTIKKMSGLNHFLQTADTGLMQEYANIAETISPEALNLITDWILSQTGKY